MNKSALSKNQALTLTGTDVPPEFVIFDVGNLTGRQPTRASCLSTPQHTERPG